MAVLRQDVYHFQVKDFLRDHDPRPCQQYAMYQSNTHSKMCSNRPPVPGTKLCQKLDPPRGVVIVRARETNLSALSFIHPRVERLKKCSRRRGVHTT